MSYATPSMGDVLLLWHFLFFGLRAAPLIWCRFAAALMRVLQSVYDPHRARGQIYIDDLMWMFRGNRRRRNAMITLFCLLCGAFKVKLSWKKAKRGMVITWIGVVFSLHLAERMMKLTITAKYAAELRDELQAVGALSMVGIKRLRKLTGEMQWP